MVKYSGDDVDDNKGFEVIPEGEYNVLIHKVELKTNKNKDEYWSMYLVVISGEYKEAGFYDNITWSSNKKARIRAKQFLKCFGVYQDGKSEYDPWDVENKTGRVIVEIGEYKGKERNEVGFAGYYTYKDQEPEQAKSKPEEDVPF